ncbi:hypothetical protein PS2_018811 [Malus domestica]
MARDLETSTRENSNVQGLGLGQSTRLNIVVSGAAPPRGITVATTTSATFGKTHSSMATVEAVPLQPSRAQALAEPASAV